MNKKLFSWKALAGLALLVAMGLTSCKSGNEVDPEDPTGTSKPAKPAVVTGDADLTLQLAVPSDFISLWKSSVKQEVKDALAKKDEITVEVKTSGMKLAKDATAATNTLTLPDFFNGATDKIVNLVFNGSFAETKSGFILDASALAGDVINATLPGNAEDGAYDLTTKAATTSVLALDATTDAYFDHLNVTGGTGKKALVVGSGINVARIVDGTGQVTISGGEIATLETSNDQWTNWVWNYTGGIGIGNSQQVYGVWATGNIDVTTDNNYKQPLENLVIAEGVTVNLYGNGASYDNNAANGNPYVDVIVGLGDITKAAKASNLVVANGSWNLKNTSLVKNVIVSTPLYTWTDEDGVAHTDPHTLTIENDIFDGAVIDVPAYVKTDLSDVTLNDEVDVMIKDKDSEVDFDKVNFCGPIWANAALTQAIYDADDEQAYTTTYYYYDIENDVWKTCSNFDDVPKANKNLDKTGMTFTNYEANANGNLWNIAYGSHYWFIYIQMLEEYIPTDDFDIVLNFTDCKVDGEAMTAKNLASKAYRQNYIKYRIDGILYAWKSTTGGWKLISVKE